MAVEDELYRELCDLRAEIRRRRVAAGRREPQICSDDALREMAARAPTKLEDFAAIPGVGQGFVDQYGNDFLEVTRKYAVTAAKGGQMDPELARTLRELQKKLVNISKGNRLLYMPRTGARSSYDLTGSPGADPAGLVHGAKRVLTLCDSTGGRDEAKKYQRLSNIIREVNRSIREKGANDLYLAYPFAEGRLLGDDDFPIRAPLALFPVILEKSGTAIKMRMDESRDAMFNNTLVLASMKMSRRHVPLPDNIIEDTAEKTFLADVEDFYGEQGIVLAPPAKNGALEPFEEYRADGFPAYAPGEYHIHACAVVGRFASYSSYIERDFDAILSKGEINGTLSDLVRNLDRVDPYETADGPAGARRGGGSGEGAGDGCGCEAEDGVPLDASERDLMYINSLNSAQEAVLAESARRDELVVQGPPGTGKSQVITGLITSAVLRGETVLMVTEKKTALDVVYSRMGGLSKYCMQIDDTSDKDRFYRQLGAMLEIRPVQRRGDVFQLSDAIDSDVERLRGIARDLYEPGDFGVPMWRLYSMERWVDPGDPAQLARYGAYKKGIGSQLLSVPYREVEELRRRFSDQALVRNYKEYSDLDENAPWLKLLRPDLSDVQIAEFKAELAQIEREEGELAHKSFLSRMFSKGAAARNATRVLGKYFVGVGDRMVRDVRADPGKYAEALDDYDRFASRATVYKSLTPAEREYGKDLLAISASTGAGFADVNACMFRHILDDHLQRFDATHKDVMQRLRDFDSIVGDMDSRIGMKREATRDILEEAFSDALGYITESKRRGDIARLVENKRKWSLNKFLGRYGYEVFKGIRVWLMTPEAVSEIVPMEMGLFDLLVFDEASQMYVERGVPSIYRAKRVVIAGDHKQLRPSSLGKGRVTYDDDDDDDVDPNTALEEESLLDLARARYGNIMLNFHYRSRYEELIDFSNHAFYGGRLYVSPNVERPERPPIEVIRADGVWEDRRNEAEADRVVALLKEILANRKEKETVGVISFNISQRDLIADRLDEACGKDPAFAAAVTAEEGRKDNGEDVGLFIKNIESVQGDERDVIVFSVGYARNSEGKFMQRFGWLNVRGGENRLNVAISRARRKIYIVSSFDPEELEVDRAKSEGPKILKKYLKYARAISDGDEAGARAILASFGADRAPVRDGIEGSVPVADRVYAALVRKGYDVERDVGIGGYVMDLAVRQGGRYVLGIECDSRVYSVRCGARERDYHRRKYLESRGWHVHRVWTPGMWKNPDAEISRVVEAIERARSRRGATPPSQILKSNPDDVLSHA